MRNSNFVLKALVMLLCAVLSLPVIAASAPEKKSTTTVKGIVSEVDKKDVYPLEYAVIVFPDYGISAATKEDGSYILHNVPLGKARVKVTYTGKLPIDEVVEIKENVPLDFVMQAENFKMKEVIVSAQASQAGEATSSVIGRAAMDHMQATSLGDVMSLIPGGLSSNQDLSDTQQLNMRWVGRYDEKNTDRLLSNAMGTAVIRDGAPISNNANLSAMNPTIKGSVTTNVGNGASPAGGVDLRSISTDNIESIEVIRGIPSVEHGDMSTGAVIINSKAGREPLRITAKANPNVYMGTIGTGFSLGQRAGAININADYAQNTNKPIESYRTYNRASARVLYSNEFGKVRSNTSLNFIYGKDQRKENPDDTRDHASSRGEDYGLTLNTNGIWNINRGWMKSLRYVLSGTYTSKQSFSQATQSVASSPYSATMTDGAVLSNFAGQHIYDRDGNEITNFGPADANGYADYLPDSYIGRYNIDSREVNVYAKLVGTMFKHWGDINNRILFGVDYKTDGNVGKGKTFDRHTPPYRELSAKNATFRPRNYRDIPFINQLSAFAEENLTWQMGLHELKLTAGVRYDNVSEVGGLVSPRFNGSFEILPNKVWLRGGWGVTAKMPSLLYLHPENAYFEYVNMNELANEKIPADERLLITTTKVYDATNHDLKIARNYKSEIGLDLKFGQTTMSVTAFEERLRDGYTLSATFDSFKSFQYDVYDRDADGKVVKTGSYPVLSSFVRPGNYFFATNRGVEFDINFGRIEAIHTSFMLNGAFFDSRDHKTSYQFYDNSNSGASDRHNVAIYDPSANGRFRSQRMNTALRITHNLPSIGFVVTLTSEVIWKQADWARYGNDSIPVGYIDVKDASVHWFAPGEYKTRQDFIDAGLGYMLQNVSHSYEIKESYSPYCRFNINVTKEIGDMVRVSFFANNMFRSYPRRPKHREPGTYRADFNNRYYFGIEMALTF